MPIIESTYWSDDLVSRRHNLPARVSTKYNSNLPDQSHMVPIRVGDFIEYSGVQFDGATIVYNMVVNLGITTSGSQAGFLRLEDAIIGIGDANADLEAARFRVSPQLHKALCFV